MKKEREGNNYGGPGGRIGQMPTAKPKDLRGSLRKLAGYLKPFYISLVLVVLLTFMSVIFGVVNPYVIGLATTHVFTSIRDGIEISFSYIGGILLVAIGFNLLSSTFSFFQFFIMANVTQKAANSLRVAVKIKLTKLPLKYYDSHPHGDILSRVTNDIDNISNTLSQGMTQLLNSAITIVGIVFFMFFLSPMLTLISLVVVPLSFATASFIVKRSQKLFIKQQKSLGMLSGHTEEMYSGHTVIKAFGREQMSISQFREINRELYDSAWKAQFMSGIIMPVIIFINNLNYVIICVVGCFKVVQGGFPLGSVQAFIGYSKQFSHPIMQLANIANIIQSTLASAERVFELLEEEEQVSDEHSLAMPSEVKGEVKFSHVDFSYLPDSELIKDMNINVKPGDTIAIVGPTGAGKTTLVNLILRFYEVDGGEITVDGVNIADMKRSDLRSIFGMVLQDTWLFKGTIMENIRYGRPGASDEEAINAAKAAYADHFIRTLPDGYNTVLNEETSNISQGEKQLLTIARAILANPRIMILDEATSSVDTRTERAIQRAMSSLMEGRTSFVIAHRLSTIRDADVILVVKDGSIAEQGNHGELLEKNGLYAELYNSQFTSEGSA